MFAYHWGCVCEYNRFVLVHRETVSGLGRCFYSDSCVIPQINHIHFFFTPFSRVVWFENLDIGPRSPTRCFSWKFVHFVSSTQPQIALTPPPLPRRTLLWLIRQKHQAIASYFFLTFKLGAKEAMSSRKLNLFRTLCERVLCNCAAAPLLSDLRVNHKGEGAQPGWVAAKRGNHGSYLLPAHRSALWKKKWFDKGSFYLVWVGNYLNE